MKTGLVLLFAHISVGAAFGALVWGLPWDLLRTWRLAPERTLGIWLVGGLMGLVLPPPIAWALLAAGIVHTGFIALRAVQSLRKWGRQDRAQTSEAQSRLMDLRAQLARLHEQERMALRIQQTETERRVLSDAFHRFEAMLVTIENHLALGDEERAERLITLFGKHLRGILNEASSPFIRLRDTLEAIRNYLALMEALTDDRLLIDLDDGMIEAQHLGRMTRNLEITPWVERLTWPLFEAAERQTEVAMPHLITADLEGGDVVFRLDETASFKLKLMGSADPTAVVERRA